MGRTLWLALVVFHFPLSASAGQGTPSTISQLVEEGFEIKTDVGYRSLVLQRDRELYLCTVVVGVWGDQAWATRCYPVE